MSEQNLQALLEELRESQKALDLKLTQASKPRKDLWDKMGAIAPIVSGLLISVMAGYFTYSYNQQQLHLQEVQTIEKFIPHMLGNEQEKKAAILAMSSLTNTELAAHFASLFASEGTVSALKSIATAGDTRERTIANRALGTALENIGERYNVDNQYEQAEDAYREALALKERTVGADDPDIPRALDKLAEIYKAHGKFALAENVMKRSLAVKEKIYGPDDPAVAGTLKSLADIYRLEGRGGDADQLTRRAIAIDEKVVRPASQDGSTDAPQALPGAEAPADNRTGESRPVQEADVKPAGASETKESATSSNGLEM